MNFNLTREQWNKLNVWDEETRNRLLESKEVYTGAIGGEFTYSFTPTNLGTVVKVKSWITNEEIDLTEYDQW